MNCSICGQPIVLVPSAAERAAKYGRKPHDYVTLFRIHSDCTLKKRKEETTALIQRSYR